ncbi:serine/threonine protein kinase HipA of HipAB toxin-antitoxin module [Rhodococcus opacus]|nr:serine/threonine protein kinase HipA of HipAB toxin-antitoxin module [Rhodococcus opacus]
MKIELIYWPARRFATRAEAESALFRYIDGWYNGGDQTVTSSITKEAATELGLAEGQTATVLIKSTEVTIGVE